MTDFARARDYMVWSQLNPSGVITPAILDAFAAIPREIFVPTEKKAFCYADDHLPLMAGRVMLEPLVLARMIEAAAPHKTDKALVLGGTTGYGAAILSLLCRDVVDVELDDRFGPIARDAVAQLELPNITRHIGNLVTGPQGASLYDVIIVEGAVCTAPQSLYHLLTAGGRLLAMVVPNGAPMGQVHLFYKSETGHVSSRPLFDAWAPYLPGWEPVAEFKFA